MPDTRLMWTESETGTPKLVERPQEPRIPSVDEVIERNDKQATQQLQQGYKQAQGLIDRQIAQGRQAIVNQHEIRLNDLKRKYDEAGRRATENTVRQKGEDSRLHANRVRQAVAQAQQSILDQSMSAKSQAMAKIQALMDKHAPEKQELDAQMQAEVQKFQQHAQMRNTRLQAMRDAAAVGIITDPAVIQQAEWFAAYGKKIPLDAFKQQQGATLEQAKTAIEDDLRDTREILKRYRTETFWKKGRVKDPITDKWRNATEEEKIEFKTLKEKEDQLTTDYQNLLVQSDPRFKAIIEKAQLFKDASEIYSGKNNTVKGGSIEASIRKKIGKPVVDYSHMSDAELRAIAGR